MSLSSAESYERAMAECRDTIRGTMSNWVCNKGRKTLYMSMWVVPWYWNINNMSSVEEILTFVKPIMV